MSTCSPDPTRILPDQTWTHPRPSWSIYSIPEGMLHRHLLSKHSRSGEHHSRTHLTIPNKPETSWIPSTNPELACSPLNPKTQYTQPQSGEARTLSSIPDWVLFLSLVLIIIRLSLPLSCSLLSLLSSVNPVSSSPYHTLSYPYTSCHYHLRWDDPKAKHTKTVDEKFSTQMTYGRWWEGGIGLKET